MDAIIDIARRHNLLVVEDAAQGVMSTYKGRALGTIGAFGCYSFHETKTDYTADAKDKMINAIKIAILSELFARLLVATIPATSHGGFVEEGLTVVSHFGCQMPSGALV